MMAVETKQGNTTTNGASEPMLASGSSPAVPRGRAPRNSALMKAASALPTVERSLEAFIAKANETLVDVGNWGAEEQAAKEAAKAAEEKRREQDALRWKQAEQQMRESDQREQAMRRQLDGLQGKLAEAEARAAVAGALSGSSANDSALHELKKQIEEATERMRAAEEKSQQVQHELASARMTGSMPVVVPLEIGTHGSDERVRLAEAKAAKAIAAARAAQAGLTVSSADLAAIESGLVVPMAPRKRSPWLAVSLAFIGGLGIMFVVWKFALSKDDAATPAPQTAVAQQPVAAPSVKPIVDDQAAAPSAPTVKAIPIEEPGAAPAPTPTAEPAPAPAVEEPRSEPKAVAKRTKKPSRAKKAATTTTASSKTKFADPFGDDTTAAKPEKAAKSEKKSEKLVDPF
ncbi:MAG TPA: hypothetical protein VIU61_12445 [Kofleriaceae bacterium]